MPIEVEHVRQALAMWEAFPVHREPRPIVLTAMGVTALDRLMVDTQWRSLFDAPGVPESSCRRRSRRPPSTTAVTCRAARRDRWRTSSGRTDRSPPTGALANSRRG
ncbi:hypothetical protein V2I01_09670 [Micromonospora sp. BRA006-A]|nr:hypothetical protein [Micromonospora sp. BRA006-A]